MYDLKEAAYFRWLFLQTKKIAEILQYLSVKGD